MKLAKHAVSITGPEDDATIGWLPGQSEMKMNH